MKTTDAQKLAVQLMQQHGLMGTNGKLLPLGHQWQFKWDNAKVRFGLTSHKKQTISLSKPLTLLNSEAEVRDTILHEIAHALCGKNVGHRYQWRSMARTIGANPSRCYDGTAVAAPGRKFKGTCPNCKRTTERHRRNKIACGACCRKYNFGRFTPKYLFVWEVA